MKGNNLQFTDAEYSEMKRELEANAINALLRWVRDRKKIESEERAIEWLAVQLKTPITTVKYMRAVGAQCDVKQLERISKLIGAPFYSYHFLVSDEIVLARLESAYEYDFSQYKARTARCFDHWDKIRKKKRLAVREVE